MDADAAGRIFHIQRYCINDGPGIRTTVFFQGCPLHCPWCHNPDSQDFHPKVSFQADKCLACGLCRRMLPDIQCRRHPETECSGCGLCVRECPADALTLLGRRVSPSNVMAVVERDRFYYDHTRGGMTLSGGEPLAQADFALALLELAAERGIHTAVETSGAVGGSILEKCIGKCDLWLFDIKTRADRSRELVGADPDIVLANLRTLSRAGCRIVLRVPLVDGGNLEEAFLDYLKPLSLLPGVEKTDILPYHDMGRGKCTMAGLPEPEWDSFRTPSEAEVARWKSILNGASAKN